LGDFFSPNSSGHPDWDKKEGKETSNMWLKNPQHCRHSQKLSLNILPQAFQVVF
jgi:hypothetical protein